MKSTIKKELQTKSERGINMRKYKIEEMAKGHRWYVIFLEENAKGEKITVEFCKCENPGGKNSLPYLWKKNGWMNRILENWYSVTVFATDKNGSCFGKYNPQTKKTKDGKRNVINFDWMLEATEENAAKLLNEIEKRAFN